MCDLVGLGGDIIDNLDLDVLKGLFNKFIDIILGVF